MTYWPESDKLEFESDWFAFWSGTFFESYIFFVSGSKKAISDIIIFIHMVLFHFVATFNSFIRKKTWHWCGPRPWTLVVGHAHSVTDCLEFVGTKIPTVGLLFEFEVSNRPLNLRGQCMIFTRSGNWREPISGDMKKNRRAMFHRTQNYRYRLKQSSLHGKPPMIDTAG